MARSPREPIFLARQTYRRRRLIDAMRVVPVVGLVLFLAPLLGGETMARGTASSGVYIFTVWIGLIGVAALLVRLLSRSPDGIASDPMEPDIPPPADNGREAP